MLTVLSSHLHTSAVNALKALSTAYPPPHGLHKLLVNGNRAVRTALGAMQRAEQRVCQVEDQLEIGDRWHQTSAEYQSIEADMTIQQYRLALDELEHLIVQRLFELGKLNMSGTGELCNVKILHLLTKISQRLQTSNTYCKGPASMI